MSEVFQQQVDDLMLDPLFGRMPRYYVEQRLQENPEWPEQYRENERRRAAASIEFQRKLSIALAPLYAELEAIGRLERNEYGPYGFIPVEPDRETYALLLKWYPQLTSNRARTEMVTRLKRPEAANWVPELIDLFRHLRSTDSDDNTSTIGYAIASYMTNEHLDDALGLAEDRGFGANRWPIVGSLWKYDDDPRVFPLLVNLANHPDCYPIDREALYALRRIGDPSTRHIFELYLDHEDKDIRKIAREGIAKVDKANAKQEGRTIPPKPVKKRLPKQLRPWPHDLPHDAWVTLMLADLLKLEDLAGLSERELLDFPGVGPATIARIKQELKDHNLSPLSD